MTKERSADFIKALDDKQDRFDAFLHISGIAAAPQKRFLIESKDERCPCHKGCTVDHTKVYYATSYNFMKSKLDGLVVKEDTGSDLSLIHPDVVYTFRMKQQNVLGSPPRGRDADGTIHQFTKFVDLSLNGPGDTSIQYQFYVAAPGCPVPGIIAGTDFIKSRGHAHTLFYDEPPKPLLVLLQQHSTVHLRAHRYWDVANVFEQESEQIDIQQSREEANRKRAELKSKKQKSKSTAVHGNKVESKLVIRPENAVKG